MIKIAIFFTLLLLTPLRSGYATDLNSTTDALLREGSHYQRAGYYLDAQAAYQTVLGQAKQQHDKRKQALAHSALGIVAYLLHRPEQAEPLLQQALALSSQQHNTDLVTVTEYYLGLTAQSRQQKTEAKNYLQKALNAANKAQNIELIIRCYLALAQQSETLTEFLQSQQFILSHLKQLNATSIRGELRLILAEQWLNHPLWSALNLQNGVQNHRLETLYQQLKLAFSELPIENQRSIAQYYGLLGRVYESQERYPEALTLTQTALQHTKTIRADDLDVFYNWQAARLHAAMLQPKLAIASYRRAIDTIQTIRQDIPVIYQDGQSSFLQLFGPLYRGALTLLLQQAADSDKEYQKQWLTEARDLMERLKQTELEDFFNDRCLLNETQKHTNLIRQPKTAVLYPIILEDRLELLLSIGDQLIQRTVNIPGKVLELQIRYFATHLRDGREDKSTNQKLYNWLIKPLESALKAQDIDTLVYIPDGSLRLLPLAALNDGQQYLLERYAIATAPSLALIASSPKTGLNNALLAGLSEPSPDIATQLPNNLLKLVNTESPMNRNISLLAQLETKRAFVAKLRELSIQKSTALSAINLQKIAKSLALPGVKAEIEQLSTKMPNQVILNNNYTLHNFDDAVTKNDYDVVHIASHGYFGGSSDDSFILTYDKLLMIDHLETLLKERGEHKPIDLIVLSACQTAEGDDRAPLGLAGVALKARASNALGSLWSIDDAAAVKVMLKFYEGFTQQGLSKAKALQQAQLSLLQDKSFTNPYFWAPFVLVGNGE